MHNVLGSSPVIFFFLLRAKPVDSVLGPVYSMYELVWLGISLYEHSTYMLNTCFYKFILHLQEQMLEFLYIHYKDMYIQLS
jgi:hypothetical protein